MAKLQATTPSAPRASNGRPPPRRRPSTSKKPPSSRTKPTTITKSRSRVTDLPAPAPTSPGSPKPSHDPHAILNAAHHAHPDSVAHQFDDPIQQHEAATLGMWAFLA